MEEVGYENHLVIWMDLKVGDGHETDAVPGVR